MILGIDEVGRGPWAGPLVVGAVVLPVAFELPGLTDSKKLSAKKREQYDVLIREQALGWGLGWVHAGELDAVGLARALRLATIRAVDAVKTPYHEIIIDGTINFLSDTSKGAYVTVLPKADTLIPAVSAASIIAKVARDAYMQEKSVEFPGYGFEAHVGYGTAKHRQALEKHGVTPLHRVSFAPIAVMVQKAQNSSSGSTGAQNSFSHDGEARSKSARHTKSIGDAAEEQVASYLYDHGYTIRNRNWRTRYCEIDIVATKGDTIFFIEVKFRSSTKQGGGMAAITPQKLEKMRRGAELYMARHGSLLPKQHGASSGTITGAGEKQWQPQLAVATLEGGSQRAVRLVKLT